MYTFTAEQRRKGGYTRALQWAQKRRENPTSAEQKVRSIAIEFGKCEFEYEIHHPDGRLQFIDIWLETEEKVIAIEIDGSHDWHFTGKMLVYDELKARWCEANHVPLIIIDASDRGLTDEKIRNTLQKGLENG